MFVRAAVLSLLTSMVFVAESGPAVASNPACGTEARDQSAAIAMAKACQTQVEILSKRSENDDVFANADGTLTLRRHVMPQRVRGGDGWVPVDATLRVGSDGLVRPVALPIGVTLSGGGNTALVTVNEGASRLELAWPAVLPTPTLTANTATYANVFPNVDLRISASVDGFQQIFVVKDREAAANPALSRIATRVTGTGLALHTGSGGRIEAINASGEPVFVSDGAYMWDSPSPPAEATQEFGRGVFTAADVAAAEDPDAPTRIETMPVELTGSELAVRPVQEMLTDPGTVYPVFIDPPFSRASSTNWTTTNSCNANSSYWTSDRDVMRVGRNPDNGCKRRAFVNIAIPELTGSLIKTASFFSKMVHSSPCASPTPEIRLSVTTQQWISSASSVTWNNTSSYSDYWGWVIKMVSPPSANASACPKQPVWVEWGDAYVASVIQWFADRPNYSTITFGLYATNESTIDSWKKFEANTSYLQVTYNHPPNIPTSQSITDCTVKCASPAAVSRRDPQLKAVATDPDAGNVDLYYEVQKSDGTPVVTSPAVSVTSGGTGQWRIAPALPADGDYRWRVKACDFYDCSTETGWFSFTVDTVPPPLPTVTPVNPNLYFADDGSGSSSGGIGVSGQFTLSGDATIDSFTWQLDGGTVNPVAATGTNPRTAVIPVVPLIDMTRTLTVKAKDHVGWESTKIYTFRVASPEPEAGMWNFNSDNATDSRDFTGKPNAIHHDGTATAVTWPDTTVAGDGQSPQFRGALFDGSTSEITIGHPVLATYPNPATPTVPRSFTVAAWVRFDGTVAEERYRTAVSQQGNNKSLFELGYQAGAEDNFCFTMFPSDTVGVAGTRACATTPVVTGEWVHLAGVYDDATDTMTLYVHRLNSFGFIDVDTRVMATESFASTWSATGAFAIGRGYNGANGAPWKGMIDEVYAAQYAATEDDVRNWAAPSK